MAKGEETWDKNRVEIPFFHSFAYNCTLHISCKIEADGGYFICIHNTQKEVKIYICCPPVAEMAAVMPLEDLVYITLQ